MIVDLLEAEYPVHIGDDAFNKFLAEFNQEKFVGVIVVDKAVHKILKSKYPEYGKISVDFIITLTAGKPSKTFMALNHILSKMEKLNVPRQGTIVAIGGGVIGDVAGLAASLWYRGCNLVHVPTTLLSAVDSCLGGKTAINFNQTINAIGSYYHPTSIFIDTGLLIDLPVRELRSGMAEVVKYCVLGNEELLNLVQGHQWDILPETSLLNQIIELSLKQKANYVTGDIKESDKRLFLNLGHTIGHAIEVNSIVNGTEQLRHGEGVAIGLAAITKIALEVGKIDAAAADQIRSLIAHVNLPLDVSAKLLNDDQEDLIQKCITSAFRDKKRTKDELRLILPNSPHSCELYKTSSRPLIEVGVRQVIKE